MTDRAEDIWPGETPPFFARLVAPLFVIGCIVLGVVIVVITYRPPPTLTAEELHDYFANQRLEFWHFEQAWWGRSDELLDGSAADYWVDTDPSGDMGGWWIEDDSVCFELRTGSLCLRVAIAPGDRIYWYSLDGDYAGTRTVRRVGGADE